MPGGDEPRDGRTLKETIRLMVALYAFALSLGGGVSGIAVGLGRAAGAPHWSFGINEGLLTGLLWLACGAAVGAVAGLFVGSMLHAIEESVPAGEGRPALASSLRVNVAGWGLGLGLIGFIIGCSERGVGPGLLGLLYALPLGVSVGLALGPLIHLGSLSKYGRARAIQGKSPDQTPGGTEKT